MNQFSLYLIGVNLSMFVLCLLKWSLSCEKKILKDADEQIFKIPCKFFFYNTFKEADIFHSIPWCNLQVSLL